MPLRKSKPMKKLLILLLLGVNSFAFAQKTAQPLPEHPRPDLMRSQWLNLNGSWDFTFDSTLVIPSKFAHKIQVPFPWGSKLSGVKDEADVAWYHRTFQVPAAWGSKHIFLNIGASDWHTSVYVNGRFVGEHKGGYTPFEFDVTSFVKAGIQSVDIRVDDKRRMFTLYGKQGYGNARGLWQTVYLDARGADYIDHYAVYPDIDKGTVRVKTYLGTAASKDAVLALKLANGQSASVSVKKGDASAELTLKLAKPRLWSLEDPYLYDLSLSLGDDQVKGYFGFRKISVTPLPGSKIPYIGLNNKPVYLQLALDQSYHPDGFYTFPSDAFMRDEIVRSKRIGLNGIRTHIKVDVPRKLYWADKLGLLVMSDVPNSWGEPDADMRRETEYTLHEMLKRDFNHPSIFSWITFNETWGLFTRIDKKSVYTPETQKWVASVYRLAKSLDPTRLVEDNSICCGRGHTETDIHSWHAYQAGYEWDKVMDDQSKNVFPGSQWNFEKGYVQGAQPMINSEFGNVWGYQGSTGDVDYTFDYHKAMNSFRNHPKMAGWLYTEHHDVINEWNGYYKFDRTEKETGLGAIVPGMTLKDLHGPFYVSTGQEITWAGKAGQTIKIPLHLSSMTDLSGGLRLKISFAGVTAWGEKQAHWTKELPVKFAPWDVRALDSLSVVLPKDKSVNTLSFILIDPAGKVLHRNFGHIIVEEGNLKPSNPKMELVSVPVERYSASQWPEKQWTGVLGQKVNGAGVGYFEYEFPISGSDIAEVRFMVEASSKPILGKDRPDRGKMDGDYMLGKGTFDPGVNPNAYPQTDVYPSSSSLRVSANGIIGLETVLADDPADHQGILSWHYQARNNKLDEAGTYGYLVQGVIPPAAWQAALKAGKLVLRFESTRGGLALYGDQSGRYVTDPSILILRK
jgi:hypothetical protein